MSAYIAHLDAAIAALGEQATQLKASGREDEAALARVKLNIHDICRTIYNVCARTAEEGKLHDLYLEKIDRLPVSWEASLSLAKKHGDGCKAVIEELKLTTLADNRAKFIELG